MEYQQFFNTIEPVVLVDDLAKFLGINETGMIKILYLDSVKTLFENKDTVIEIIQS